MRTVIRIIFSYCLASIFDPDHLCFRWTTYDNINGLGWTIYVIIFGPAGPLMYPDQISRYSALHTSISVVCITYQKWYARCKEEKHTKKYVIHTFVLTV